MLFRGSERRRTPVHNDEAAPNETVAFLSHPPNPWGSAFGRSGQAAPTSPAN